MRLIRTQPQIEPNAFPISTEPEELFTAHLATQIHPAAMDDSQIQQNEHINEHPFESVDDVFKTHILENSAPGTSNKAYREDADSVLSFTHCTPFTRNTMEGLDRTAPVDVWLVHMIFEVNVDCMIEEFETSRRRYAMASAFSTERQPW